MNLTKQQVIDFYELYSRSMGIRYVNIEALDGLAELALAKIPDKYRGLLSPAIDRALCPKTLRPGLVLIDFTPGSSDCSFGRQIDVGVEEAEHSEQMKRYTNDGGSVISWYRDYFNPSSRGFCAIQEGAAKAAAAEVRYFLDGTPPEPPDLSFYLVGKAQNVSDGEYRSHIEMVKELGPGASTFDSSRRAIRVLRKIISN